jgi:arylsulfatase A-like enzyme
MTIDLLPTIAKLTGGTLSTNRIDGLDIWPLLSGQRGARSPHEAYWFYWGNELHAIRSGPWKLHFPHPYVKPDPPGHGGQPGKMTNPQIGLALFNLARDRGERNDVAASHPEIVARLQALAARAREDLGDGLNQRVGKGTREPGKI